MKHTTETFRRGLFRRRGGSPAIHRGRIRRSGAAMVEMAIVLPVLVLFIFGIIEYGWVFYRLSQINLAARHGVRAAVRPAADAAEVNAAVAHVMNGAGWTSGQYQVEIAPNVAVAVGEPIEVHVLVARANVRLTGMLPVPAYVGGRATMAKEGP